AWRRSRASRCRSSPTATPACSRCWRPLGCCSTSRRPPVADCGSSMAGARARRRVPQAPHEPREKLPTIVIAAGGTAGHVVPALAVAGALRAEGAVVSFVGTADRSEAELVPAAGYELDTLRVRGLDRGNPLRAAQAI